MPTQKALDLLAGRGLEPVVSGLVQAGGSSERVLAQSPPAGFASGAGLGNSETTKIHERARFQVFFANLNPVDPSSNRVPYRIAKQG